MKTGKHTQLITLSSRCLTGSEADALRGFIANLKARVHLVLPCWRWIEARGLSEQAARSLVDQVATLGVRFNVAGWRAGPPSLHVSAVARGF